MIVVLADEARFLNAYGEMPTITKIEVFNAIKETNDSFEYMFDVRNMRTIFHVKNKPIDIPGLGIKFIEVKEE